MLQHYLSYISIIACISLSETSDGSPFPTEDLHSLAEQSMISGCAVLSNVIVQVYFLLSANSLLVEQDSNILSKWVRIFNKFILVGRNQTTV
jgi:hypothetical protein